MLQNDIQKNKGPDNPTSQLLPKSRNTKFQRDGEGRIDKGGGGGVQSLYVQSCVWQSCVCVKEGLWQRWCETKMCVKDGV